MQFVQDFDRSTALPVGLGIRILLLTDRESDPVIHKLAALGGQVTVETEFFAAMAAVIDDPFGFGLLVVNCDGLGGAETGRRALSTLVAAGIRLPVMAISGEHQRQEFPQSREDAVLLRTPVSSLSLRIGFEHALRDRLLWGAD